MSTSGGKQVFVTPEHRSVGQYAALTPDGTPAPDERVNDTYPQPGHAGCSCGAISQVALSSKGRRRAWHTRHREEAGCAPWSDAQAAAESSSRWPAVFDAEVPDHDQPLVWRERSPNCWEAPGRPGFVVRVAVIETVDGSADTWIGHTLSDNVGEGATRILYFRLLDLLAERLRSAPDGGWEVGCRRCGERWPCPVREFADLSPHPDAEPAPDALDHVPYGVIKHG